MKLIVRIFALSLVVTGAVASTHIAQAAQPSSMHARISAMPVPMCPPNDPNGCYIGCGNGGPCGPTGPSVR